MTYPRGICDFCSDLNPVAMFTIPSGGAAGVSDGDSIAIFHDRDSRWAACAECAELVEAGDSVAVAERSIDALVRLHPYVGRDFARVSVVTVQSVFWAGYQGGRREELAAF